MHGVPLNAWNSAAGGTLNPSRRMNRNTKNFTEAKIRRFYTIASTLYALSIAGPAILTSAGNRFGFMHTSFETALSIYLPLGLLLGLMVLPWMPGREIHLVRWPTILFCYISTFWLINYCFEVYISPDSPVLLSDFDSKRIWLFVSGFMFPSIIGIAVSRKPVLFIQCFFPPMILISAISSLAYLTNYDSFQSLARLLGEQGLLPGIIASWGGSACLSLLLFREKNKRYSSFWVLGLLIVFQYFTVILSGTRMAMISFAVCIIVFGFMAFANKNIMRYIALVLIIVVASIELMDVFVPAATVDRILSLQESGPDIRRNLVGTVLRMISDNPLGKVVGYENSPLGMDYCHNTILQMIAEAGLQIVPALIVMFRLISRNVLTYLKNPYYQGLSILGMNIFMQSCSSGSAYNPQLVWFLLFFMASLKPIQTKGTRKELE